MILIYGWHLIGHSVLCCTYIFISIVTLSSIKQYFKNSDPKSIILRIVPWFLKLSHIYIYIACFVQIFFLLYQDCSLSGKKSLCSTYFYTTKINYFLLREYIDVIQSKKKYFQCLFSFPLKYQRIEWPHVLVAELISYSTCWSANSLFSHRVVSWCGNKSSSHPFNT